MSKIIKIVVPVLIIVIVAAIFVIMAIDKSKMEQGKVLIKDSPIYTLIVGGVVKDTNAPEPEKELRVLIKLNGNPYRFYTSTGLSYSEINYYLCNGQNKLEIEGQYDIPFQVKIVERNRKTSTSGTIFETQLPNIKRGENFETAFNVNIPYQLAIYEPNSAVPADSPATRAQITALITDLYNIIKIRHSGGYFQMVKNSYEFHFELNGNSQKEIEKIKNENFRLLLSKDSVPDPFDSNSLKFIWGKQLVMVYTGFGEHGFRHDYLFSFSTKGQKSYHGAVRVAYINGKWQIW